MIDTQDHDFTLELPLALGRRAKRTLRKSYQWTEHDMFERMHKPLPLKAWEKIREESKFHQRRKKYELLQTIHQVLANLPQDVIYIIQHKAGMNPEAMPLPNIIYRARVL